MEECPDNDSYSNFQLCMIHHKTYRDVFYTKFHTELTELHFEDHQPANTCSGLKRCLVLKASTRLLLERKDNAVLHILLLLYRVDLVWQSKLIYLKNKNIQNILIWKFRKLNFALIFFNKPKFVFLVLCISSTTSACKAWDTSWPFIWRSWSPTDNLGLHLSAGVLGATFETMIGLSLVAPPLTLNPYFPSMSGWRVTVTRPSWTCEFGEWLAL